VAVRRGAPGLYELAVSPGARVTDLVAAAATLPRQAVHTTIITTPRGSAPTDPATATVLVFREPPARLAGKPAPPSPDGRPPCLLRRAPDIDVGFDIEIDIDADPARCEPAA
jgi:hypothetical protein